MRINRHKVFKIVTVIIFLIVAFNPISTYLFSQLIGNIVIKPTLFFGDRENVVLKSLRITDWCDPLPCANTYIVLTSRIMQTEDFRFCSYSNISGNIHIVDRSINAFRSFGSNKFCTASSPRKFACKQGSTLTRYIFYRLFPFPSKIDTEYYSCEQ